MERLKYHIKNRTLPGVATKMFFEKAVPSFINTKPYCLIYKKIINKKAKQFKLPRIIAIETTNFCNARCDMCPHKFMTRKKRVMDMELFKKIINQLVKYKMRVMQLDLNGFGEPMLDPLLEERIKYIKKKTSYDILIYTNAIILAEERAEKLLKSGIDHINVSFHDSMPNYELIKKHALFLLKKRKELKAKTRIFLSFVKTRKRSKDKEFVEFWKDKADSVIIVPAEKWGKDIKGISYTKWHYKEREWPCKRLWTSLFVGVDGRVFACCRDYDGRYVVGDFRKQNLKEIWDSKKMQYFRQLHLKGEYGKVPMCDGCGALVKNSTMWWI